MPDDAHELETDAYTINSWDELSINPLLLRGIYAYGFENPSPIQKKSIVPILKGKDVIAQAQSGTGKTACFAISSIELVNTSLKNTQAIIMSPTRELSAQIKSVVDALAINISSFKSQLLVGGTDLDNDIINLKENQPHVIIGCPGRIYDILRRKYINLELVKLLILDEADEMLSTGFKEQVYNIFNLLPSNIQKALFSASMPNTIDDLINKFVTDPIKIVVKSEQLTLDGIKQYFVNLENDTMKYETLKDLFSTFSVAQCIIYCNSVTRVSELYDAMNSDGYPVCQIHSSLDKMTRQQNYDDFRRGKFRVLISSNVTARGIDIQQVSTVINFDVPKCIHSYLHRIGRSGRWGRKGVAINFITRRDYKQLKEIESFYQTNISELPEDYK
jgi:superfamily II DNA/RNA helicase